MLERHRAGLLHLGRMGGLHPDLQVEGGDAQLLVVGRLEQDRGEDRHGALLLDDALRAVEGAGEFVGPDLQLHLCLPF